jgi:hypothetical protein
MRWLLDAVHPDLGRGADYRFNRNKERPLALEEASKPSKWTTTCALRVLRLTGESDL